MSDPVVERTQRVILARTTITYETAPTSPGQGPTLNDWDTLVRACHDAAAPATTPLNWKRLGNPYKEAPWRLWVTWEEPST